MQRDGSREYKEHTKVEEEEVLRVVVVREKGVALPPPFMIRCLRSRAVGYSKREKTGRRKRMLQSPDRCLWKVHGAGGEREGTDRDVECGRASMDFS